MNYVRIKDGVFTPVSVRQIVKAIQRETGKSLPDLTSVPEGIRNARLADYEVFPYTIDPEPAYDSNTQRLSVGYFRQEGDAYARGWVVEDIPQAEREAEAEADADRLITNIDNDVVIVALALIDAILQVKDMAGTPSTEAARQAVRARVLQYARQRRGL